MNAPSAARNRNGTIEFLRFLCCAIILVRHASSEISLISEEHQIISRGSLCVEFFFLVSGYLMVCSAAKHRRTPVSNGSIGKTTSAYILKKVKGLMPNLAVAYFLSMGCICVSANGLSLRAALRFFAGEIYKPFLLATGNFGHMSEIWYICFMLLVMMVFYPMLIKNFDLFTRSIAPLVSILLLGWIARTQSSLVDPSKYIVFIYKGLIRAFGEIALGASLYHPISYLKKANLTSFARAVVTIGQVAVWGAAIFLMTLNDKHYDFFILILIAVAVVLAFSHQGAFSDRMDNRFNGFLGKLSLTVYLSHRWVAVTLDHLYPRLSEIGAFGFTGSEAGDVKIMWILYLISAVCACAIVFFVSAALKKAGPRLSKLFQKVFIRQAASIEG